MGNMTVIGAQWGDEGKGKIVDLLSGEVDMVVRFQGGNNAGHTVIVDGERYVLHVIPSGILHHGKVCVIGNGVVLDPETFLEEVDALAAKGIDVSPERLMISPKAHLIMPYHRAIDAAREGHSAEARLGTTGRGIGPCYEDKKARIGIRAGNLAEPGLVRRKVTEALREKNVLFSALYGIPTMDPDEVQGKLMSLAPRILPYLADVTSVVLNGAVQGKKALFEGAQGVMLDVDHGTYPYVTSSNTIADNASVGSGVPSSSINTRIAIVKAYTTRVGAGPFPTELDGPVGMHLQQKGRRIRRNHRACASLRLAGRRGSARNGPTVRADGHSPDQGGCAGRSGAYPDLRGLQIPGAGGSVSSANAQRPGPRHAAV